MHRFILICFLIALLSSQFELSDALHGLSANQSATYRHALQTNDSAQNVLNETLKNISDNMISVQGGTFNMGCTSEQGSNCSGDEYPEHKVTVYDFKIDKYDITQTQWRALMDSDPGYFKKCDNCPVENVNWNEVQEFIRKLNIKTGKHYRLPTEAEWEYAARGGDKSKGSEYSGSNNIDSVAWYAKNSTDKTRPVGQKKANELGLYDMTGLVSEWCSDYYGADYYLHSSLIDPKGPDSSAYSKAFRVVRGGCFLNEAYFCRISFRRGFSPKGRGRTYGFRLAED